MANFNKVFLMGNLGDGRARTGLKKKRPVL
jgi:hypothetical protein